MLRKYIQNSVSAAVLAAVGLLCSTVTACEFHDAYSSEPWMRYGKFNHNYSTSYSKTTKAQTEMNLAAPSMIKASKGEEIVIEVDVEIADESQSESLEVLLKADSSISIINTEKTQASQQQSLYSFTIVPHSTGTFRISFSAKVKKESKTIAAQSLTYLYVKG